MFLLQRDHDDVPDELAPTRVVDCLSTHIRKTKFVDSAAERFLADNEQLQKVGIQLFEFAGPSRESRSHALSVALGTWLHKRKAHIHFEKLQKINITRYRLQRIMKICQFSICTLQHHM